MSESDRFQIEKFLAAGSSKSAVELAKTVHKRCHSAESEALLTRAYRARIAALFEKNMNAEAEALLALVEDRHPSSRNELSALKIALKARRGDVAELARRLADPATAADVRRMLEAALRKQLRDPAMLVAALPAEHPLRRAAASVCEALSAVTSRPVTDAEIQLPEVARHSPLAPWKMMVRAIACLYRNDKDACERYLVAIDAQSPPARVVPAMRLMLGQQQAKPDPPALALASAVSGGAAEIRQALLALDSAFALHKRDKIVDAIRAAVRACESGQPALLLPLRQAINVRGFLHEISPGAVKGAMRGTEVRDARFWRLIATAVEQSHAGGPKQILKLWDEFRVHAVHEGWFSAESIETAAIYTHIADVLARFPREEIDGIREELAGQDRVEIDYRDQPPAVREAARSAPRLDVARALKPEELYSLASKLDPHVEVFERWLAYAQRTFKDWRPADDAALAWHQAMPRDVSPLLFLTQSAEKRDALRKAITYLEKAEELDSLNPEVGRARVRLLIAEAVRHLGQKKTHLAARDLSAMAELRGEKPRPAVVAAIAWAKSMLEGDTHAEAAHFAEIARLAGDNCAARFVCSMLARACGIPLPDALKAKWPATKLLESVAGACLLCNEMNVPFVISPSIAQELAKQLASGVKVALEQLRVLGETALRNRLSDLAYAISVAGLAQPGPLEARFLLIRGRALPDWARRRAKSSLIAAAELARRQHDSALAGAAIDELQQRGLAWDGASLTMSPEELQKALSAERAATEFPDYRLEPPGDEDEDLCNCPACRANRRGVPFEDFEGDDGDGDEDDFAPVFPEGLGDGAPELDMLLELALRMGLSKKSIEQALKVGLPPRKSKRWLPPPEGQGGLF